MSTRPNRPSKVKAAKAKREKAAHNGKRPPKSDESQPEYVIVAHLRGGTINMVRLGLARPGAKKATLIHDIPYLGNDRRVFVGRVMFAAQVAATTVSHMFGGCQLGIDATQLQKCCKEAFDNVDHRLAKAVYVADGKKRLPAENDGAILVDEEADAQSSIILPPGVRDISDPGERPEEDPPGKLAPELRKPKGRTTSST